MPQGMQRRHFLQAAAGTLAALGWQQQELWRQGDRLGAVLARPAPRKLALLVGINDYPATSLFPPLQGCLNDVELQYHLLVHRFGFEPQHILKLTDAEATRAAILETFTTHLIEQARPDDVVVFHFSGHGSQVLDPDREAAAIAGDGLISTLVPYDSPLPPDYPLQGGAVRDISALTLFLLMKAVPTPHLTVVLDSCYAGGGTRGNLQVRSRPGGRDLTLDAEELATQAYWRERLGLSPAELQQLRRQGIANGVAIAAAQRDQPAADMPFDDFYAGAFTYTLSQYLWQQPGNEPVPQTIPNVARRTAALSFSAQEPQVEIAPQLTPPAPSIYFVPKQTPPAEAVITKVMGDRVQVWFGGLDPDSLAAFKQGARLMAIDPQGQPRGLVQVRSRSGLVGVGQLIDATPAIPGAVLQEQGRGIPANITLRLGLHESLGTDLAIAQTALATLPRIEAVPLPTTAVQFIVGRVTPAWQSAWAAESSAMSPAIGSIGLFYPDLAPLPASFGIAHESMAAAIARLAPKLRSLLAARLVKLVLNAHSSRLPLTATLTPVDAPQLVASVFTSRSTGAIAPPPTGLVPTLPLGTAVQIQLHNPGPQDLYVSILVIDATGTMAVLFPNQWVVTADITRVAAGSTLTIPGPEDGFALVTQAPLGSTEVLILASTQPLTQGLRALRNLAAEQGQSRGPLAIADPTPLIEDFLADLATPRSRNFSATDGISLIDTRQLAALAITFEVV